MWAMPIFNARCHPELCQERSEINCGIKFPLFLCHSFPSRILPLSHGGYHTTRSVFPLIILSTKDPLSGTEACRDQPIHHFFLGNWATVSTRFALLQKGCGWGASAHDKNTSQLMCSYYWSWYLVCVTIRTYCIVAEKEGLAP